MAPFHPLRTVGGFVRLTLLLLAFIAPATAASISLTHDLATGEPGKFAADEIRREAAAKGITLAEDAKATRISIIVDTEANTAAQGYSLRVHPQHQAEDHRDTRPGRS